MAGWMKKIFGVKEDKDITEEEKAAAKKRMSGRSQSPFVKKAEELDAVMKDLKKRGKK